MAIQNWIHRMEEGAGSGVLKLVSSLLGFVLLAMVFNLVGYRGLASQEAMETAQLGRQLARGKGYTTQSIRPLAVVLLQQANPAGAKAVLNGSVPDVSNAPGYPFLLSCLMRALPFKYEAQRAQPWYYEPDFWIAAFNEGLLFTAVLLLFQVARRLFDAPVAWLSGTLLAGTELFWRFSVSGLSTIWLIVLLLALVWCLVELDERERRTAPAGLGFSLALAAAAGVLLGIGALSRYAFAWMIIPTVLLVWNCSARARGKLSLLLCLVFLAVLSPWVAREYSLSNHWLGTADYALVESTPALPDDHIERSLDPGTSMGLVLPRDVVDKLLANGREILRADLPRLGGSWVSAFFLCGLLVSFRSPALRRFRYFLMGSLALLAVAQALGRTHLSEDSPEINSENLLVLLAPLVLVFGVGFFFTLLEQAIPADPRARAGASRTFAVVVCAPLLLTLLGARSESSNPRFDAPYHIQRIAALMKPEELMMSDIPSAVAWYGDRPCMWLTLDDSGSFAQLCKVRPVQAVFLTQRTSDRRFLSQLIDNQHGWGMFMLNGLPGLGEGEIPNGFPLKSALLDLEPDQMFITDHNRWPTAPKR